MLIKTAPAFTVNDISYLCHRQDYMIYVLFPYLAPQGINAETICSASNIFLILSISIRAEKDVEQKTCQ